MDMIKAVLNEELESSLKIKEQYLSFLTQLPKGSISKKKINGKEYYYLLYRKQNKIKTDYLGKLSKDEFEQYKEKIAKRKRYKQLLKQINQKIKYLRKAINVKPI